MMEKREGVIEGCTVFDGKPTREWLSEEDSASPTASLESVTLTVGQITIQQHTEEYFISAMCVI